MLLCCPDRFEIAHGVGTRTSQDRVLVDLWFCRGLLVSRKSGCCAKEDFSEISNCLFLSIFTRFYYRWGLNIPATTFDEKGSTANFSEDSGWPTKTVDVAISRDRTAAVWWSYSLNVFLWAEWDHRADLAASAIDYSSNQYVSDLTYLQNASAKAPSDFGVSNSVYFPQAHWIRSVFVLCAFC